MYYSEIEPDFFLIQRTANYDQAKLGNEAVLIHQYYKPDLIIIICIINPTSS